MLNEKTLWKREKKAIVILWITNITQMISIYMYRKFRPFALFANGIHDMTIDIFSLLRETWQLTWFRNKWTWIFVGGMDELSFFFLRDGDDHKLHKGNFIFNNLYIKLNNIFFFIKARKFKMQSRSRPKPYYNI